jgi:hypothetical protein
VITDIRWLIPVDDALRVLQLDPRAIRPPTGEEKVMHKRFAAAVCADLTCERRTGTQPHQDAKGPPTGGDPNTNYNTNATDNANSVCVFSGLNDYQQGQTDKTAQTPADGPPGAPGHGFDGFPNGCKGGSNPDRTK